MELTDVKHIDKEQMRAAAFAEQSAHQGRRYRAFMEMYFNDGLHGDRDVRRNA